MISDKPLDFAYNRRSIRLPGYDYSKPGAYFITICSYQRFHYFGEITDGTMIKSELGQLVGDEWEQILQRRQGIALLDYCIMPNHFHGIIAIMQNDDEAARVKGTTSCAPTERFGHPIKDSIPTIIRSFKAGVTNKIMKTKSEIYSKIWQRGYYEHIIRNEVEKWKIIEYINNNPINWEKDFLYTE